MWGRPAQHPGDHVRGDHTRLDDQHTHPASHPRTEPDTSCPHPDTRPPSLAMTHAIIGGRQPTRTSLRSDGTGVTALVTIGANNDYGDATMPLVGAIGHDLPMDTDAVL